MPDNTEQTENHADDFFPNTKPSPGFKPSLLSEVFQRAEVTPYDVLRDQLGMDYDKAVARVKELRTKVEGDWLVSTRLRVELGGACLFARTLAEHGNKGEKFYDEIGISRNTVSTYIDLYRNFAHAYPVLMAEWAKKQEAGETYSPSQSDIIAIGRREADRNGFSRGDRATFTGTGKALMIDPVATVEAVDLPTGFPGTKAINPHWTQNKAYELQTGGFGSNLSVGKGVETQLWIEEGGNQTAYYEFDLPLKDSSQPKVTLKLKTRAILLRVNKKEVLEPLPADAIAKRINFNAREPKLQSVFDIDPTTGKVDRLDMMDDELVISPDGKVLTLLTSTPFTDLSLMQIEPNSVFAFTIAGQRFKGRSFLLRLEDGQWIAPLGVSMSAGDIQQHVVFNTLEAAVKEAGEELPVDPNDGFEELNNERCSEYFGVPYSARLDLSVRNLLEEQVGTLDINAWINAGYAKSLNNKTLFNISKVRQLADDATARVAQAEADGFRAAEPYEYGAANHGEAHDLAVKALGSRRDADLKGLVAAGYLRIIGGKRLYQIERMRELMETGRAALERPTDVQPEPEPVVEMTETTEYLDQPMTDVTEAAQEPIAEAKPEFVDVVQEAENRTADERMRSDQPPATVTPEVIEPEIIEANYAKMDYEARSLANRKVIDSLSGWLKQVERTGIACLTRSRGRGQADGATTREWLADALDTVDKMVSIVRKTMPDVAILAEHLDILMAEAMQDDPKVAIKRDILRVAPHLAAVEVLACYVKTPDPGVMTIFGEPMTDQASV